MSRVTRATRLCLVLLAAGPALLLARPASAIGLQSLLGGGSLSSADGAVTFGDFSVSISPWVGEGSNALADLDLTLVDVDVVTVGDWRAIAFDGPIEVGTFELGQIRIDYTVRAGDGFEIVGADLSLKAETIGLFSSVSLAESISGDAAAVLRAMESEDEGSRVPFDGITFDQPARQLGISNEIALDGGMTSSSRVARLEQGFTVAGASAPIPEPGAALLFGAGTIVVATRLRAGRG